jgi:heme exporter protein C
LSALVPEAKFGGVNQRKDAVFYGLLGTTALCFLYLIWFIFMRAPVAQAAAGGLTQKILYFHAPAAYCVYLSGVISGVASAAYLLRGTDSRDAWARSGAECAVAFGLMMLTSGPLWAKKAWGVYWVWDPRLTTTLLTVLIYAAVVVLRSFAGEGEAERRFAAALSVLGTFNLPIIHYSVQKWGGNHPVVVGKGGGGLGHPDMKHALLMGFVSMTLLAVLLLWSRARLAQGQSRLGRLNEQVAASGIGEGA